MICALCGYYVFPCPTYQQYHISINYQSPNNLWAYRLFPPRCFPTRNNPKRSRKMREANGIFMMP